MFLEIPLTEEERFFFSNELEIFHLSNNHARGINTYIIRELFFLNSSVLKCPSNSVIKMAFSMSQALAFVQVFKLRKDGFFADMILRLTEEMTLCEGA